MEPIWFLAISRGNLTQYFGWQILVENSKVVARFGQGATSPSDINRTTAVNNGNWHHFALVYPTQNSNAVLYVDGNRQGSPGQKICAVNDTKFRIGDGSYWYCALWRYACSKRRAVQREIDDVMIFNEALSAEEIWSFI